MSEKRKINVVVVGNGMVGYKFCEKLLAKGEEGFNLTVFGEENLPAYDRVHLSKYFEGKSAEELLMAPPAWYSDNGVMLYTDDRVTGVDRLRKLVSSRKGRKVSYDYLVFATGSSALVPPVEGVEKNGVFVYRTLEDLDMIRSHARHVKKGAVLGGGLLGLEAAKALLDLGLDEAHVVEFAPRLMPRQIDAAGSAALEKRLSALGLSIHLSKCADRIIGTDRIEGISFNDGSVLYTDMLIISAGIRPRDELAARIGLETHPRGGIIVDDNLKTSDPAIFAIGECACPHGMIYGLVAPGYEMAEIVASQLVGAQQKSFSSFDMSAKLKLVGVDVASFGDPLLSEPECQTIVYENKVTGVYKRINISHDGKYLLGGVLVGDAGEYNMLLQTYRSRLRVPSDPQDLILGRRGAEQAGSGVMGLPDDALICSCEGLTKGFLADQISNCGHKSFASLKKATKVCTGCGGCGPLVKDLIQGVLKEQGVYVRNVICEHFDYSRQEILDLIRINGYKTYSTVLEHLGKGDGCEVCKPLVGSVLASLWNENILQDDRAVIQDTNDRFLANIQRGGTYSVVPRIPGGEITPEKLIVIGEVARKYGLYTKITGGQRIDLFGAHVSDLPLIWEELIAAGFESGHAYGKALRTVKSCVGSTWCRFGVQDSVSFAIEVENRYKGLRGPHKIKSAVSGCIRECAEAQSKDFGIIATEKGWNLYVCGNGGSKPQHAQLLASDLDSKTCIRLIDRFLMFYIKTADPLTRTATWLNKMEGGMAYLRAVVVDDSLGIAEELERDIQSLIDAYKCEWKEAVENPVIRKRFQHFINAPSEKDPTIRFETLRDQKKAANW